MASWQPPDDYRNRPVTVLGGGVLGRRIAACWIAAGYDVVLRDPSEKSRNDAVAYVNAELGTFEALIENSRPGKVEATDDLASSVKRSWLVFEAVPEVLKLKEDTFAELERSTPSDCILASNSSSYKSSELVGKIKDETKSRVLNTHYMMPPDALTVELMTDGKTHPALIDFLFDRHKEAGLHPIVALKESTGFVFNRIWAAIKRECLMVLQEGVSTAADIDRVFKEQYGAKDGPCHLMDLVGLDTVEHIERHYIDERGLPSAHADWLHDGFVSSGKLGAKSSKGGLYDKAAPGAETKLFVLNLGMAETLHDGMSFDQIAHRGQVLSLNADQGGKPTQLVGSGYLPDGIDVSTDTKRLYWTQMGTPTKNDGSVLSSNLDGSDIKTIVPEGSVHTPKQCRVDAVNKKLYFCDREGGRVMRVNLDGSEIETLYRTANWQKEPEKLKDEKNWCVGIAPSPKTGKIYWTQKGRSKGSEGRIFSANIDMPRGATAADRTDVELVIGGLPEPIDLELNDDETVLYWTDRGELPLGNTLNMKTVVGPQPESEKALERRILAQGFGEAIGLKFDVQKNAIWVADMAGRIWKCNPDRPAPKEKVFEGATAAFTGLTLIHV